MDGPMQIKKGNVVLKKILILWLLCGILVLFFCVKHSQAQFTSHRIGVLVIDPNDSAQEFINQIDFQNTSVEIGASADATVDLNIAAGLTRDATNEYVYLTDTNYKFGIGTIDPNVALQVNGVIRSSTAEWYHCKYIHGFSVDPGASGATFTAPDTNTLGGYNLDADSEYLYFQARICADWDETSDVDIKIFYEVDDADATGDAVFDAVVYMKGDEESSTKSQSLTFTEDVSGDSQYTQHVGTLTVDYDNGSNPVESGDILMVKLNFDATNSDVTDVIFTHAIFRYQTKHIGIEI